MSGTCNTSAVPAIRLQARGDKASWSLVRTIDNLLLWHERIKSRRVLASLDERMLRDIGMDHATARREAGTPFWR
jgi:uncharacterized protein YjiS (DUF1127 family)